MSLQIAMLEGGVLTWTIYIGTQIEKLTAIHRKAVQLVLQFKGDRFTIVIIAHGGLEKDYQLTMPNCQAGFTVDTESSNQRCDTGKL